MQGLGTWMADGPKKEAGSKPRYLAVRPPQKDTPHRDAHAKAHHACYCWILDSGGSHPNLGIPNRHYWHGYVLGGDTRAYHRVHLSDAKEAARLNNKATGRR